MNRNRITVRYARALFGIAREHGITKEIAEDAHFIFETLQDSPQIIEALKSPGLYASQKNEVLQEIFGKHIQKTTGRFLRLIVHNKRESYMKDVFRNVITFYRTEQGIVDAEITTAVEVQENTLIALQKRIEDLLNAKVEMHTRVKEDIIGGFILRFDDKQLDASIKSKLKKVRHNLLQSGEMN